MERLTEECWKNLDPWECCGQDKFCTRGCHDKGGCTNGCIVPKMYCGLAKYEDIGLTPEQIREVDKLYTEKCEELAKCKKAFDEFCEVICNRSTEESFLVTLPDGLRADVVTTDFIGDLVLEIAEQLKNGTEYGKGTNVTANNGCVPSGELNKDKLKAIYKGFSQHDCAAFYQCPVCKKTFNTWYFSANEKLDHCPCCKTKLGGMK